MAFKKRLDLDCDSESTISLGGTNRMTGKKNPTSAEGYYLGFKQIEDQKKKSGFSKIHIFNTPKGNVGVWGKTDSDSKLTGIAPGTMTRITFDKMLKTANGEMYKYVVETDEDDVLAVSDLNAAASNLASTEEEEVVSDDEEASIDDEEKALDEVVTTRAKAPSQPLRTPSADTRARVQSLLNGNRNKTA
jgi:hypothetical protein